jgi:UDP-3-O-[3-hydroxymyristoyl] N-acetylglucosamine deacetylase
MQPEVPPRLCQGTVAAPVRFSGRGLHFGRNNEVGVMPAEPGAGIVFQLVGRKGRETIIPARWDKVRSMPLCTCLAEGHHKVRTVEHLMAALYACGVDNATVRIIGNEIPLLDGSAQPFIKAINTIGVKRSKVRRKELRVAKPIHVTCGTSWARLRPAHRLVLDVVGGLGGFPASRWRGPMNRRIFAQEIAAARTYGHLTHGILAKLSTFFLPNPICLGANLGNAVVVYRGRILSPGGLRFPDEFVRHRVLDLMGDLMLAGVDLVGHLTCRRPTHELNRLLLDAVLANPATSTDSTPAQLAIQQAEPA